MLLAFVLIGVLTIINTTQVSSHLIYPPVGACGDPTTELTCAQSSCHGSPVNAASAQSLAITIGTTSNPTTPLDSNFRYIGNQTYYITFSVLAPAYAFGFEMTAMVADSTPAGVFTVVDASTTKLQIDSTYGPHLYYISHLFANHTTSSWTYKWTAPDKDSGAVTFYYAFNPADSAHYAADIPGSGIYSGQTTIQSSFDLGVNNISDNIRDLQAYPNPVNGAFNLYFDVEQSGPATALVYSIDGKLCKQLFSEQLSVGAFSRSYDISSLAAGVYLLKLNINGAIVAKKLIKE